VSACAVFVSFSVVALELSALLQPLRIEKPIKRLEVNAEIFVIVLCFGD
jgi:hypothetical protein